MLIRNITQKLIRVRELAHLNQGSPGLAWINSEFKDNTARFSVANWFESDVNIITNAASEPNTLTKPVQVLKENHWPKPISAPVVSLLTRWKYVAWKDR